MTAQVIGAQSEDLEENWDDEFAFEGNTNGATTTRSRRSKASDDTTVRVQGHNGQNQSRLTEWAESGPSTPPKRQLIPEAENWDDDFEDRTDSPVKRKNTSHTSPTTTTTPPRHIRRSQQQAEQEPENWDDDFDTDKSPRKEGPWESSDEELEGLGMGFSDQEDKTVTARSRRGMNAKYTPPPVPPLPSHLHQFSSIDPFPTSPSPSVFSVPQSGRDSVAYSFASSAPLRPGAALALPPSPPQKERRRLRKKSRPPDHNVFELLDRSRDGVPPESPQRSIHDLPSPQTPPHLPLPDMNPSSSPPNRTPLLSRINSVKKWGVSRKKRSSTTPSEVELDDNTPRPPSRISDQFAPPLVRSQNSSGDASPFKGSSGNGGGGGGGGSGWFFRSSGGGGPEAPSASTQQAYADLNLDPNVKHQQSIGRLRAFSDALDDPSSSSASPAAAKKKKSIIGFLDQRSSSPYHHQQQGGRSTPDPDLDTTPPPSPLMGGGGGGIGMGRRPASMQVQHGFHIMGRSVSRSTFEGSTDDLGSREKSGERGQSRERDNNGREKEGFTRWRRISLVKKHRSSKSIPVQELEGLPGRLSARSSSTALPLPQISGLPSSGSQMHLGLLPPIQLDPPSPYHRRNGSGTEVSLSSPMEERTTDSLLLRPSSSLSKSSLTQLRPSPLISPSSLKSTVPALQQASSLGRSTPALVPSLPGGSSSSHALSVAPNVSPSAGTIVPRRNSLGDLKIPARISQAQVGLKRDLGMVREFARSVERLKELLNIYHSLVAELQAIILTIPRSPSRSGASALPIPVAIPPRPEGFLNVTHRRARSNTNPSSAPHTPADDPQQYFLGLYHAIDARYQISWECAELLIELGSGSVATAGPLSSASASASPSARLSPPTKSISVPPSSDHRKIEFGDSAPRKPPYHRERAITLTGDESKPAPPTFASQQHLPPASILVNPNYASVTTPLKTPNPGWRASTGRNDLSQRQLWLLRDMLNSGSNSSEGSPSGGEGVRIPSETRIEEESGGTSVNRGWKWGADAMGSTVTLPSEESAMVGLPSSYTSATGIPTGLAPRVTSLEKKNRRMSRLGMSGLRDMLKSLTKNVGSGGVMGLPSAAISTESSLDSHGQGVRPPSRSGGQSISGKSSTRRRARTSTGPELTSSSIRATSPPFSHSSYTTGSTSTPRRPSIASIFRFSQKSKSGSGDSTPSNPDVPPVPRTHGHTQESSGSEGHSSGSAWDSKEGKHGDDKEEEEDWDRVESSEDVEMDAKMLGMSPSSTLSGGGGSDGSATIRGRKSMSPWKRKSKAKSKDQNSLQELANVYKRPEQASSSSSSLAMWAESAAAMSPSTPPQIPHGLPVPPPLMTSGSLSHASSLSRPTRLSNVEETPGESYGSGLDLHISTPKSKGGRQDRSRSRHSPHRPSSRTGGGTSSRRSTVTGSVRSAPSGLQDALSSSTSTAVGNPKLAMTPENIKPLLENAKEVHARCEECIGEIKDLLAASQGEVGIGIAS